MRDPRTLSSQSASEFTFDVSLKDADGLMLEFRRVRPREDTVAAGEGFRL